MGFVNPAIPSGSVIPSPTFTGTVTFPDGSTWTSAGPNIVKSIVSALGTITTSQPALTATQTWNDGAVTFVGQFMNVTSTASAAASLLADWQVGGVSQFKVTKGGALTIVGGFQSTGAINSTDGRFIASSSIVLNMTSGSVKVFASDGTTPAPIVTSTYQSNAPAGATAGVWKFGSLVAGVVTPDTTRSVFVDIGGVVYKLIVST